MNRPPRVSKRDGGCVLELYVAMAGWRQPAEPRHHLAGISPKHQVTIEGRPFYVTKDGHGKVIEDLIA